MCPNWGKKLQLRYASNLRPFGVWMRFQPAEPYQPELWDIFEYNVNGDLKNVPITPLQSFMNNFIDLILS